MSSEVTKAITTNERFLRHVQHIAGLGAYVLDISAGTYITSEILDDIFGLPADYPRTTAGWVALLHPDDRQVMVDYFSQEVLGQCRRFDKEYRIIRVKDGMERWVHGYGDLEFDAANRPITMTGTIQDVTERKANETLLYNFAETLARRVEERTAELEVANAALKQSVEQLRASQSMLSEMGRTAAVGGWELDVASGKQTWTEEVYRIHEVGPDYEPTGEKGIAFYAPAVQPIVRDVVQRCIEKGEPFDLELEFITARGRTRWVHAIGRADFERGRIHGTFQDVTDHKLADNVLLEKNAALDHSVAQLRKLAMDLTQAEESERKRLASLLHDNVQQYIAAATMKVSVIDGRMESAEHDRTVQEALSLLGEALDASRSLTVSLCPPVLLEAGLMPGLRWLADWVKSKHGLTVKVVGGDVQAVSGPLCVLLFQAVRELLFNVVKHAGVTLVTVMVEQPSAALVRVIVIDGGKGFSPQDIQPRLSPGGFGLFNIRERIAHIGGEFAVASKIGKGTRVSITVPL